jgi:deoxyadenosine/deoxycytidine kinase
MWMPTFPYSSNKSISSNTDDNKSHEKTRPRLISLEGNIGAGKSTFIEHMKSVFQDDEEIIFLQEPVDIWESVSQDGQNMLQLFYKNPTKYSFAFQILAFTTRLRMIKKAVADAMKPDSTVKTIVMERSLEADKHIFAKMLYDEGKIEPCEFQVYQMMSEDGLSDCSADGIIWLATEAEECHKRIGTRGREGEEGIDIQYLQTCGVYHGEWLGADLGFVFRIDDYEFVGGKNNIDNDTEEVNPTGEKLDWEKLSTFIRG